MERFEKLNAYQVAYRLCLGTYTLTRSFPKNEQYALVSQMRRAAYSVIANIAEGSRAITVKERQRYNQMAIASLEELKCFYRLSSDLGYCRNEYATTAIKVAGQVGKMLVGLNRSLRRQSVKATSL